MENEYDLMLSDEVTSLLMAMGMPAANLGFYYAREAVILTIKNGADVLSLTKFLYPEIANRFKTKPELVERNIRHNVEIAYTSQKMANFPEFEKERNKPCNGVFIATVANITKRNLNNNYFKVNNAKKQAEQNFKIEALQKELARYKNRYTKSV